jgi:hypothetical protein
VTTIKEAIFVTQNYNGLIGYLSQLNKRLFMPLK